MQNIHAHVWDDQLHLSEETRRQFFLSRGRAMRLSLPAREIIDDMQPFDRVVVFGLKARSTGFWVPDDYVADWVAAASGKFVGFASCDPTQPDYLDELRHGIETRQLRGVKMAPMYANFDPRDPRCRPVYEYCQRRRIPILFHAGTTFVRTARLEYTRPWLFDEIAIDYPELRMVLAHLGHPFEGECIVVIRKHPHLYADLSALFYRPWQFYQMLILAQEYNVTGKLLFGTDSPFAGGEESIRGLRQINHVIGSATLPRVREEVIEAILSRDAFGLLGIEP